MANRRYSVKKTWLVGAHIMIIVIIHIIYIYIYILWTEWSLFRMWFNSFQNTLRLCLPTFQRHAAEAQLIFLDMGTSAKHCVWRSIPWNTMGGMYTVFPSSPHLHPPCSALWGFAEHEGWELVNFRWCTYARIGYMCGSSSPGARWALPDRNPRNISGFAASYRHLYKRKGWKLQIGIGYIELSLVKRKETKLILYKAWLRILSQVNLCDAHQWRRRSPQDLTSTGRSLSVTGMDQSVRFFLYWGAGCGLSVGEGRDDFADVGICFGAILAFAGPAAADDDELE